jgi:hypothetical protein
MPVAHTVSINEFSTTAGSSRSPLSECAWYPTASTPLSAPLNSALLDDLLGHAALGEVDRLGTDLPRLLQPLRHPVDDEHLHRVADQRGVGGHQANRPGGSPALVHVRV